MTPENITHEDMFEMLGGKSRPQDKRDLNLGSVNPSVQIPPSYFTDISGIRINMQNQLGICGAEAGSKLREIMNRKQTGNVVDLSPRYSWIDIKSFDGYGLNDGTDMTSIFKSGSKKGYLSNNLLKDDTLLDIGTYSSPTVITGPMNDDAQLRVLSGYAFNNNPSFDQICQDIYSNGAVILLLKVGQEMWTRNDGVISWLEKDVLPLRPPAQVVSGHFVVAYGYDQNYIYCLNSWSENYGRQGTLYFGRDYIPFVIEDGTEVIPPVGYVESLIAQKKSLMYQISYWLQKLKSALIGK